MSRGIKQTKVDYLALIEKHNIKITPVMPLSKRNNVTWFAGFVELHESSGCSITRTDGFAFGTSPQEAIDRLIAGKTCYEIVEDGEYLGFSITRLENQREFFEKPKKKKNAKPKPRS